MITKQTWICPEDLINQALKECPDLGEGTVLNEPTGDFFYDGWKIRDLYKGTPWEKVLDTIPMTIGQARIIKLDPGESYMAHADIDNRWHLNLTGDRAYLIDLDNNVMHKCIRDNYWSYMDAGRIHAATNFGSKARLQVVVRELLQASQDPIDLVNVFIEPAYEQYDFRYKFDNIFSPWLNRMNQQCKMSNFSHNTASLNFKLEREYVVELESIATKDFKITYG
jgi:hypothetical protein